MDKKKILDYQSIKKKIRRISLQILESNIDQDEIIIAGIDLNGFIIAKKISQEISKISRCWCLFRIGIMERCGGTSKFS